MTNYATQQQNSDMMSLTASQFRLLYNPVHAFADAIAMLQMFPAVRGIWTGAAVGASGQMRDEINGLHLTNNNNAQFGYKSGSLVPRVLYDGSTEYHSRASEAAFNITGTEAYINQVGLTLGAWVQFDNAPSATEMILSKWLPAANLSYNLNRQSSGVIRFAITNDGSTAFTVDTVATTAANTQYFVCGRFTPSTSIEVFINGTWATNITSIPASIFSGVGAFEIASNGGGTNFMDGRVTLAFLCASAVPNVIINNFYQMTAPLFNVNI